MKRIDISKFQRDSFFYDQIDLLITVKSFDLQAIRKRYLESKKNKRSGSTHRRKPNFGGVVSLSLNNGKLYNDQVLSQMKEPRGIDFLNNKLAVSSEDKVFIITDKVKVLENDYFSYIHTVSFSPFNSNILMVSSSGFDCIFEYELKGSNVIWEWFAWENGFHKGKNPVTNSDVLLTRDNDQAKKWQKEGKNFLLIDKPKTQSLPTAQRSAFINSVAYHMDNENLILATFFYAGKMIQINKIDNSMLTVIESMKHPHGGKQSDTISLATSTNSGEVVLIKDGVEYRYYTNELEGKALELVDMEWLQNSIIVDDNIITIDSNRTSFLIFNPDKELYDLIPYNMNWAIQDMVCGILTHEQKILLKEASLSNE
ncbi:MAG: hypothetical protein CMD38_06385 [Flavobacteriales bacterium]|nr:hypothetical protein [Flavobacteriales bacterium]|tara:strand:+ start:2400 stop:3509 length:1110 start_codon:yes stop_codon:yes gene_type:complete